MMRTNRHWIIVWFTPPSSTVERIGIATATEYEFSNYVRASRKSWALPRAEFYDLDEAIDPELDAQYNETRAEVYAYARQLARDNNVPFEDDEDPKASSSRFLD